MLKKYKYEGKNKEEAWNKAKEELNIEEENVIFKEEFQEGKLFKASKYSVEIIQKQDIIEFIKEYINEIKEAMNFDIKCEIREKDGNFYINMISDSNAILIGKDGKNLNAIQTLIKNTLLKQTGTHIKVFIDASGYKERKLKILEAEVKKIAREVQKSKVATKLDPMNSYERLILHNALSKMNNIQTRSEGEEPNRYIIIEYKED